LGAWLIQVSDDANRLITTTGDLTNYNDNALKQQVLYDQLGRTTEARAYETSTTYITAKTNYDALGRVKQVSNPYRAGDTVVWTTSNYDALGRVTSVTTPDNAVVSTSYSGNTMTVTDQNGKQRKSVTDALGRLTQVYEDPAGLNYLTSYTYDVLGNLRQVDQGGQMRYFSYDSLSRLLRAHNPEQVVNTGLNLTDAVTDHSQWTMGYAYDENSNLLARTDARGVVTSYAYDALNRNTTVSYSDGVTPQVTRFYDGAGIAHGTGRLWKTETANTARTQVSGFDAYGRPLSQTQQFWLNSAWTAGYTVTPTFNLAGGMTAETYPSGHTVNYGYDAAGRLSSFTGNLGDGVSRNDATGLTYSVFGDLSQEQFGTNTPVYNKSLYNIRGQLSEIRVSTTPNDTSWNRGAQASPRPGEADLPALGGVMVR
jgi:YD repeat-containing protein